MRMKRHIISVLILMAIFLSSCFGNGSARETISTVENQNKRILVAYFSGTGNTKRIAEIIADKTGAELFEVEPKDGYTSSDLNYRNTDSRVYKEHDNLALRSIELKKTIPDSWDSYDIVFIGFPIWWGIPAWPINGFVSGNNLEGKIIIPFATSASSPLGDSMNMLKELSDGGDWKEGIRFSSRASEKNVEDWINTLDL